MSKPKHGFASEAEMVAAFVAEIERIEGQIEGLRLALKTLREGHNEP